MMNDWQKIKDIFALAVERPPAQRSDFLHEICGGNAALKAEIESLLAVHDEPEHLIERGAYHPQSIIKNNHSNYDGKKFGKYQIIKEIGRGGMGAVFLAERSDGAFEQKIALKIIRQSFPDAELERHFLRERQILASLNHPNIAQLFDGGVSESGELFLAMEYVEGVTLLDFAVSHEFSGEECLQLFLKVCRAVSFAHRNLIVHRDIKPSNIIVNDNGEPKLLDFGLAKIVESAELVETEQTQTIFRAFTPAYASPEQIRGVGITTASDVYSLGVILYELLTGAKPFQFDGKNLDEILETINYKEPVRPSEVQDSKYKIQSSKTETRNPKWLKGDLDNIILKSLQKETERRYNSVEALAGDIERHLNGLLVSARPNTVSYRASKFFKRNKIAVSAVAFVILALTAGLAVALRQTQLARAERARAEKRFADVRQLSNSLLFEITPKIENLSGSTEAREILVKRALEYLDSLAEESQRDSQLQSELASAYEKVGDLQGNQQKPNLSDFPGAVTSFEKANQIRRVLPATDENLTLLAQNFISLSEACYNQNNVKGALENSAEAMRIYENLTAHSASPELENDYLEARITNAQMYSDNSQFKAAIPLFRKILESLAEIDQNRRQTQLLKARVHSYLANALSWDGAESEAATESARAIELAEPLAAQNLNDANIQQQLWRTYMQTSSIYENTDDRKCLEFAAKAAKLAEKAVAADGANMQAKHNLAKSYSRVGISLVLVGNLPEALESLQNAEKILNQLIEKEPKNLAYQKDFGRFYIRLGDLQRKRNDFIAALKTYKKSAAFFETIALSDEKNTLSKRDLAQSLKNVGDAQLHLNKMTEAKQTFQKSFEILNSLMSQNALGEYDRKLFDEVQTAVQKL